MKAADEIYSKWDDPQRSCMLALRSIILKHDGHFTETIKYGMPCFCYQDKHFCYLWTDKKTLNPYILMVEGGRMKHPQLEQGTRKRMKVLNINPNEDLPIAAIQEILQEGIALYG